jgi:alpha-1,6-mannosyltransferase
MNLRVARWSASPTQALIATGLGLIGLTALGASLHVPGAFGIGSQERLNAFVALCCIAGLIYFAAVAVVLRCRLSRRAIWGIVACAAALRLIPLLTPPFLSTDVYRYVWDGRVQAAGINPYRYIPAAPELAPLRDDAIYPRINRATYAPTIYPPAAQAIFGAVAAVSSTVVGVKLAMVAFEVLALLAMVRLLDLAGLARERILIYAWHPLPVWEFAGNGHIDAAAIGLIALALLARIYGRATLTGMALGAAVLVKFLPIVLFPALWRRWNMKMPAAFVAIVAVLYLLYIDAGARVLGFLPGYVAEEGMSSGAGFYFLSALDHVPAWLAHGYIAVVACALAALGIRIAFSRRDFVSLGTEALVVTRHCLIMATALIVGMTPHFPWYFAWLILPCCLVPLPSVLYLTAASFLLYLDPNQSRIVWPTMMYAPFAVLAWLDIRRRNPSAASPLLGVSERSL